MDLLFGLLDHPLVPYLIGAIVVLVAYQKLAPRLRLPGLNLTPRPAPRQDPGPRLSQPAQAARGLPLQEAGQLPGGGEGPRGGRPSGGGRRDLLEGSEYWAAASNSRSWAGGARRRAVPAGQRPQEGRPDPRGHRQARPRPPRSSWRRATTWRRPACTAWRATGPRRPTSTRAAAIRCGRPRPTRRPAEYSQRGGGPREALHGERLLQHHLLLDRAFRRREERVPRRPPLREGGRAGARALRPTTRAATSRRRRASACSSASTPRRPSCSCARRTRSARPRPIEKAGDKVAAANLRGEVALQAPSRSRRRRPSSSRGTTSCARPSCTSPSRHAGGGGGRLRGGRELGRGGQRLRARGPQGAAAASYERAGDYETAARLYEEAGLGRKAIELYEKAGFTFKSGESAARAGERDKAIALLQRVSPDDEHYRAASELLAQLFVEAGKTGLAVERLQKTIAGAAHLVRQPRPLLLAGGGPRGGRQPSRGDGDLPEDPGRERALPRRREAGGRAGASPSPCLCPRR